MQVTDNRCSCVSAAWKRVNCEAHVYRATAIEEDQDTLGLNDGVHYAAFPPGLVGRAALSPQRCPIGADTAVLSECLYIAALFWVHAATTVLNRPSFARTRCIQDAVSSGSVGSTLRASRRPVRLLHSKSG